MAFSAALLASAEADCRAKEASLARRATATKASSAPAATASCFPLADISDGCAVRFEKGVGAAAARGLQRAQYCKWLRKVSPTWIQNQ